MLWTHTHTHTHTHPKVQSEKDFQILFIAPILCTLSSVHSREGSRPLGPGSHPSSMRVTVHRVRDTSRPVYTYVAHLLISHTVSASLISGCPVSHTQDAHAHTHTHTHTHTRARARAHCVSKRLLIDYPKYFVESLTRVYFVYVFWRRARGTRMRGTVWCFSGGLDTSQKRTVPIQFKCLFCTHHTIVWHK